MRFKRHSGFTLIELLIVIAIIMLMLTFVYLPYAHYQEKIKVRQVIREVSQGITEARNMAINGFDQKKTDLSLASNGDDSLNKSIGLFIGKPDGNKSSMHFYSYPHTLTGSLTFPVENILEDVYEINKGRTLPTGTQFESAMGANDGIFFFFDAITGNGMYYLYPDLGGGSVQEDSERILVTPDIISLEFSYKGSPSPVLRKSLIYDTRINTTDY